MVFWLFVSEKLRIGGFCFVVDAPFSLFGLTFGFFMMLQTACVFVCCVPHPRYSCRNWTQIGQTIVMVNGFHIFHSSYLTGWWRHIDYFYVQRSSRFFLLYAYCITTTDNTDNSFTTCDTGIILPRTSVPFACQTVLQLFRPSKLNASRFIFFV